VTTLNKVLLAALVLQSGLALLTRWPDAGPPEPRDLLGVSVDDIQVIRVTGRTSAEAKPEGGPLELARQDTGWVIRSKQDYPAAEAQITPLLESLGKLRAQTPIATSSTHHQSLEVADDSFLRKVELETKDGTKKTLLLGSGQGKSAAVRVAGEDEVWSVRGVSSWNIADVANRYFEREILKVDAATLDEVSIQRPTGTTTTLRKTPEGTWTLDGLIEGQTLDQAATTTFLNKLVNLRMVEPIGKEAKPEHGLDGPQATVVRWTGTNEGQSVTGSFRVGAPTNETGNRYYVQVEGNPWVVEVMKTNLDSAINKDPASLVSGSLVPEDVPPGHP
jgi:hypothetical protein